MAEIQPFRGITYNPSTVPDYSQVIAPPFDDIPPAEQERLYAAHAKNIVRIALAKKDINAATKSYEDAAALWSQWRNDGTLVQDDDPAVYVTSHTFTHGGKTYTRTGFISLVRVEDEDAGVILPHEKTFSAPKEDRLNLLRAMSATTDQVFTVFADLDGGVRHILEHAQKEPPMIAFTDSKGHTHKVWRANHYGWLQNLQQAMADKPLLIADGHHRFATSRAYRDEQRKARQKMNFMAPSEFTVMYCTAAEDPGLLVLPYHRVVKETHFSSIDEIKAKMAPAFECVPVNGNSSSAAGIRVVLKETPAQALCQQSQGPNSGRLDVEILHEDIFARLGISSDSGNISFFHDEKTALSQLQNDPAFHAAFLVSAVPVKDVLDRAQRGQMMPQKSTYFYPKLLTGLVMRSYV